ncbi:hypothetical protein [Myceligenerans xiligouense]|uniref:DUF4913 domain-containing protein n=1 Tax=Myceligenerans xiligouense TaxID=253184 RepID=A0A3N4YMG1_9MICO|nr:hypothetical protein [Myceligenerans xiligouense]RPF21307.1 hypothetical protein EDD34_1932 [Myceligenerans xiligouense]
MDENLSPRHDSEAEASGSSDASAPDAESLLDAYLANAFALPGDVAALHDDGEEEFDEDYGGDEAGDSFTGAPADGRAGERGPGASSDAGVFGEVPLRPLNLRALTSVEAEIYWRVLDDWVTWLRGEYGLGVSYVPPLWHRHAELRWELSALHTAWLASYHPEASALAPVAWHRELGESLRRLHDWVAQSGTTLAQDRPTSVTVWPGEPGFGAAETWQNAGEPTPITDRAADFEAWLADDLAARRAVEARVRATLPMLGGRSVPGGGRS